MTFNEVFRPITLNMNLFMLFSFSYILLQYFYHTIVVLTDNNYVFVIFEYNIPENICCKFICSVSDNVLQLFIATAICL